MFDFIIQAKALPTKITRYYFHQAFKAVEYLHKSGFCHRDIKLENLLLDRKFNLKLADFSFACELDGKNLKTYCGTETYMSPEQQLRMFYDGEKVDIFALGVLLFIMETGFPPFGSSKSRDLYYKCLTSKS